MGLAGCYQPFASPGSAGCLLVSAQVLLLDRSVELGLPLLRSRTWRTRQFAVVRAAKQQQQLSVLTHVHVQGG